MSGAGPKYVTLLLVTLALAAAGCGSSSSSSSSSSPSAAAAGSSTASSSTPNVGHLPTVKFVLHAGLAFGAFHRYLYKPFKAGAFSGGLFKHKLTVVKAGLAALFVYHELKLAVKDAQASPKLSKLIAPLTALADKVKSVGSSVKSGNPDASSLSSANGDVTSLSGLASAAGVSVPDQIPSAAQLASGGVS
jgi:hypothetical protein